jgi:hypothetical protein
LISNFISILWFLLVKYSALKCQIEFFCHKTVFNCYTKSKCEHHLYHLNTFQDWNEFHYLNVIFSMKLVGFTFHISPLPFYICVSQYYLYSKILK